MADNGVNGWYYGNVGNYYGRNLAVSECANCRFLETRSGTVGTFGSFKYVCSAHTGCAASQMGQGKMVSSCSAFQAKSGGGKAAAGGGGSKANEDAAARRADAAAATAARKEAEKEEMRRTHYGFANAAEFAASGLGGVFVGSDGKRISKEEYDEYRRKKLAEEWEPELQQIEQRIGHPVTPGECYWHYRYNIWVSKDEYYGEIQEFITDLEIKGGVKFGHLLDFENHIAIDTSKPSKPWNILNPPHFAYLQYLKFDPNISFDRNSPEVLATYGNAFDWVRYEQGWYNPSDVSLYADACKYFNKPMEEINWSNVAGLYNGLGKRTFLVDLSLAKEQWKEKHGSNTVGDILYCYYEDQVRFTGPYIENGITKEEDLSQYVKEIPFVVTYNKWKDYRFDTNKWDVRYKGITNIKSPPIGVNVPSQQPVNTNAYQTPPSSTPSQRPVSTAPVEIPSIGDALGQVKDAFKQTTDVYKNMFKGFGGLFGKKK